MNEHIRQDPPAPRGDEATDAAGVMNPPQQKPRGEEAGTAGVMDPPQQKPSDVMPHNRAAIDVAATDVMAPPAERPETD